MIGRVSSVKYFKGPSEGEEIKYDADFVTNCKAKLE